MRLEGCQSMADLTLSPAISACSPNVFQCSALCLPRASVSCLSSSPAAHPLPATRRRLQKRGERIAEEISAVKIRYSPLELKKLSGKRSRSVGGVHAVWKQARDPSSASEQSQESKSAGLELIQGEEQFDRALAEAQERSQPIVIDWMAAWCRKCIYLKPKLEKLADEFHPDIKFYCVDVNNVPQALVKRAEVTKMPTIQLWKNGEKQDEVIGGHKAWLVVEEVREMLQKHLRQ